MAKYIKLISKKIFYYNVFQKLIKMRKINIKEKTLIVGGHFLDRENLIALGFENVTISNLDERMNDSLMAPFKYEYQDAENLTFPEDSFETVITSHCLHHCRSPHKAFIEMMRVARKNVIVLEGRDSFVSRLGLLLGSSEEYEKNAVKGNGFKYGGVNNTCIPNHVYRWNEHEVKKIVKSYFPELKNEIIFFYSLELNYYVDKLRDYKNKSKYLIMLCIKPILQLLFTINPKQSNKFAFYINTEFRKDRLQPWLKVKDGKITVIKEMLNR